MDQLKSWCNEYKDKLSLDILDESAILQLDKIDYKESQVNDYVIKNLNDMELYPKLTTINEHIPPKKKEKS